MTFCAYVRVCDTRSVEELCEERCLIRQALVGTPVGPRHVGNNHLSPRKLTLEPAVPRPASTQENLWENIQKSLPAFLHFVQKSEAMLKRMP